MSDQRENTLRKDGLYIGIAALSLLNGMHFSPYFDPVFILAKPFAPAFFVNSPLLMFYLTSLLLSAMTLVIGGVPAAIYERARSLRQSTPESLWIWLGGILLLTLPTIFHLPARVAG